MTFKFFTGALLIFLSPFSSWSQSDTLSGSGARLQQQAEERLAAKAFTEATALAHSAYEISRGQKDSAGMSKALYVASRAYAFSGAFDSALQKGMLAATISQAIADHRLELRINNNLGWAYFMLGAGIEKSMALQQRQLYLVNKLKDSAAMAMVYNNYGYDATVYGSTTLDSAIYYTSIANGIYGAKENNDGRWYTLMNLCWQYRLKDQLDSSAKYGKLATRAAYHLQDRHAIIESYTMLGETLLQQHNLKAADTLFSKAQAWANSKADRDKFVFDIYHTNYLWLQGKKLPAIDTLLRAIAFLSGKEVLYEMQGRVQLAQMYHSLGRREEALAQIKIVEQAKSDYISFETRFLAAFLQETLDVYHIPGRRSETFTHFLNQAKAIGAAQLLKFYRG